MFLDFRSLSRIDNPTQFLYYIYNNMGYEESMYEYAEYVGIDKDDMDTDSVLSLMDMFAIPYKATVLRLYESNCIKRHKAEELFRVTAEDVAKRVELTGKAKRWQLDGSGTESFGTLLEKADYNTEHDYLTESREKEDWKYISELKKELGMD